MTAKGRESNFTKVKKRFSALNRCFAQYPKGGPNYRGINKEASQLAKKIKYLLNQELNRNFHGIRILDCQKIDKSSTILSIVLHKLLSNIIASVCLGHDHRELND